MGRSAMFTISMAIQWFPRKQPLTRLANDIGFFLTRLAILPLLPTTTTNRLEEAILYVTR